MNKVKIISDDDIQIISNKNKKIKELKHPSLLKFLGYDPFDFKKQNTFFYYFVSDTISKNFNEYVNFISINLENVTYLG